uniref:Uncharacterized protein n=1 Tax=Romanomermis culicivorax TaxID=13658 RepID=A0A915K8H0_ROMCU
MTPAPAAQQQLPSVPWAPITTQSAPQRMARQLLPMVPMDIQLLQTPSTSTPNLDHYGQQIRKPAWYKHSVKQKTQQQEEVESHKAHKTRMMDELHAQRTLPPSTSLTEHNKTLSQRTIRCCQQWAKQKE